MPGPSVERFTELLCRPKVIHVMQVRAVCGLFRQEVVNPSHHDLDMPHPSDGHRPSLAKGADTEIVKSVRHTDPTSVGDFGSSSRASRNPGTGPTCSRSSLR